MRPLHSIAAIALSAVLGVPVAFAQLIKSDQKIDNADAAAMKQLAQANLAEIEAGKQRASAKIQEHLQLAQRISQGAAAGATSSTTPVTPSTPPSGAEIKPNINFSK